MAIQISSDYSKKTINITQYSLKISLTVVTLLFFMWGFSICMKDFSIPYVKKFIEFTNYDSLLGQFAFLGSCVYILITALIPLWVGNLSYLLQGCYYSIILLTACYMYLVYFGIQGYKIMYKKK